MEQQISGNCTSCGKALKFKMINESIDFSTKTFNKMLLTEDFADIYEVNKSTLKISCDCGKPQLTKEDLAIIKDNLNFDVEIIIG